MSDSEVLDGSEVNDILLDRKSLIYEVDENGNFKRLNYVEFGYFVHIEYCTLTYNGVIYYYDWGSGVYREDSGVIDKLIQDLAIEVGYRQKITSVIREVKTYVKNYRIEREYPFNKYPGIPVKNGVLKFNPDRAEFEFLQHNPEFRFTYRLNVIYDKLASGKQISDLINDWCSGHGDSVKTLYQIPGQALLQAIGFGPYKKSYILDGPTHAGKSTFLNLLNCLVGGDNVSNVSLHELANGRFSKADLVGKLLNSYDELSDVDLKNISVFKAITGAFYHQTEKKHRDPEIAKIFAVHLFSCNRPPVMLGNIPADMAFWGRWEYLIFSNTYEKDPTFEERMFTEENLSGFFNDIIAVIVEMIQKNRLLVDSQPQVIKEIWTLNSNPVLEFMEGNTAVDNKGFVVKQELYSGFLKFVDDNCSDKKGVPSSEKSFFNNLRSCIDYSDGQRGNPKRMSILGRVWKSSSKYKPVEHKQSGLQ